MATYGQFLQWGPFWNAGVQTTNLQVFHYAAGTTNLQNVWTDRAKSVTAAQPVVSDANGIVSFYADGLYKFVIKDGTTTLYTYDNVDILDTSNTGGKGANIASASTLVLGTDGAYFHITGAVTITALSGTQNSVTLTFDSTPQLTNSGSLILAGGANYTCTAGDTFLFVNDGSNVWREVSREMALKTSFGFASDFQGLLDNLTFTATVGSNNLTIALKTKAAADPSTTDAVRIAFRSATLTAGTYVVRTVTAALSLVIVNTQTLGTVNATAARLYIGAMDNAGTVELFIYNPLSGSNLLAINEQQVYSTSTPGNNAQTLYSTAARSNLAVRLIGYIEISEMTAGTWATSPTVLQIMGPSVRKTGDIVQTVYTSTGAMATGITTIPHDNTIPQNTEGDQYMTLAITPTSAINLLYIEAEAHLASSTVDASMIAALFQDSTANALKVAANGSNRNSTLAAVYLSHEMSAGTASATTMKIRGGQAGGATTTFNGEAGASFYNGTICSFMRIIEYFV